MCLLSLLGFFGTVAVAGIRRVDLPINHQLFDVVRIVVKLESCYILRHRVAVAETLVLSWLP